MKRSELFFYLSEFIADFFDSVCSLAINYEAHVKHKRVLQDYDRFIDKNEKVRKAEDVEFNFRTAFDTGPLWTHETPLVFFMILVAPVTVPTLMLTGKIARYCIGYPIGALCGGIAAGISWLAEKVSSLVNWSGSKATANNDREQQQEASPEARSSRTNTQVPFVLHTPSSALQSSSTSSDTPSVASPITGSLPLSSSTSIQTTLAQQSPSPMTSPSAPSASLSDSSTESNNSKPIVFTGTLWINRAGRTAAETFPNGYPPHLLHAMGYRAHVVNTTIVPKPS